MASRPARISLRIASLGLSLIVATSALAVDMYRWVDERGVTNVSDAPERQRTTPRTSMHTLKPLLAALLTIACTTASAQSLALYRGALRLTGAQEMPDPPDPTPFRYHVVVSSGDIFQAKVIYTDAAGTQTDLTGGQRVMFQPTGCIDATPGGLITIPAANDPREDCRGQMARLYPTMWVYALDGAGHVLTANAYAFRITAGGSRGISMPVDTPLPPPRRYPIDPPPPTE